MATKTAYPFRVEPQEVDFSLRITLVALGGNILNIAGIDAHTKGFGVDALNKDNFSWVLSRIAFEFDYRPEEYVKYEIATWISDYGRMLSTRNFELTDQTGVCFGRVVSQWCMLDLSKRTAVDLRAVAESHNDAIVECPSPAEKPRKVPAPDAGHDGTHDTVIPLFLIHLVRRTSPDAEINNQKSRNDRCQHHEPGCGIPDQLFCSFCQFALTDTACIGSLCVQQKHGKSGKKCLSCRLTSL